VGDRLRKGLCEDDLVALGEVAVGAAAKLVADEPDHEQLLVTIALTLQLLGRKLGREKEVLMEVRRG